MPFRPKRPLGRHFADGSGWGPRYDRWESAHIHTPMPVGTTANGVNAIDTDTRVDAVRDIDGVPLSPVEVPAPEESRGEEESQAETPTAKASIARSSFVMFLGTFFSRFLGLVRAPILMAAVDGMTSPAANAFDVANKLPNLIYMIIVGGLVNAVLVPAIVRATKQSDDDGAAFINKLLTLAIVFLGGATLLITLAAPVVVKMYGC